MTLGDLLSKPAVQIAGAVSTLYLFRHMRHNYTAKLFYCSGYFAKYWWLGWWNHHQEQHQELVRR